MTSSDSQSAGPVRRRAKRFLTAEQKYDLWLRLVRGESTVAQLAAAEQIDRTTVNRIRTVAKDGALAALAASKPGVAKTGRDAELDQANAEIARLNEAVKELAIKLTLLEGKGGSWT